MRNDMQKKMEASPSYAFFFREKIKNFFEKNAMDLQLAKDKVGKLVEKYIEHELKDGESKPVKIKNGDGVNEWKYLDGNAKVLFETEYEVFMQRSIKIYS